MPPEENNYDNHENLKVFQEQKDTQDRLQNERLLKTNEKTAQDFIKKSWDLLHIDNDEKKQIEKKLWDKAPEFLAEI